MTDQVSTNDTFRDAYEKIGAIISRKLNSSNSLIRLLRGIIILVLTGIAGAAQFPEAWPTGTPKTIQFVGVISVVMLMLLSMFIAWFEKSSGEELESARIALDKARELELKFQSRNVEIDVFQEQLHRATSLYLAMHSMRGALERINYNDPAFLG